MPVFEKPPLESLPPARDRWTPLYLEHGRLEVDDSSVKWIGADRTIMRLPVATLSALMLGPGTSVTHAAVKACSDSNTPVCWVGEDGMRFYAFGVAPNHDNERARLHAQCHASRKRRTEIARKMFAMRFPEDVVTTNSIQQLRGMEGMRVRALYQSMGAKYGVSWKGRHYNADNWNLSDNINKAISAANASLYALCTSVVCSLGFLPQLGFIHSSGTLPFVFDIADLYKPEITLEAAFHTVSLHPDASAEAVLKMLKLRIEETRLMHRLPKDIGDFFV